MLTLEQFNQICDDFIDTKVNTIDYIGFLHTLVYVGLSNVIGDNDTDKFDDMYYFFSERSY